MFSPRSTPGSLQPPCTPTRKQTIPTAPIQSSQPGLISPSRRIQPLPRSFANAQGSISQHASAPWHDRHILLPWDLKDESVEINEGIWNTLRNIFPRTTFAYIGHERAFVLFRVDVLPSAPWPKTVGGLPAVILLTQRRDLRCLFYPPLPYGVGGCKTNRVSQDDPRFNKMNVTLATVRVMATTLVDLLTAQVPQVTVYEVVLTIENVLQVYVDDKLPMTRRGIHTLSQLVGYVGPFRVIYMRSSDLGRKSTLMATRSIDPDPITGIVDTTGYEVLRPGVVLAGKADNSNNSAVRSTSSGVLVQDGEGRQYMTAATHGIGSSGEIYLPSDPQTVIGTAEANASGTDIALVKLADGVSFENRPFSFDHPDAPHELTRIAEEGEIRLGDVCYMETPYTGILDGFVCALSIPVEASLPCTGYTWLYFGQDEDTGSPLQPPASVCGSVIWNSQGSVYGFYRFYMESEGVSLAVSASKLKELGFSLV